MAAKIYIVSGFLGAGKTTLIRKLLKESFPEQKVVLVENDFGEISVDAALLRAGGVQVKEINSGCICCSLSGDFVKALEEVLKSFRPDVVVIEPSGVGKLSDIFNACQTASILPLAGVERKITVTDAKRFLSYLENFGEFFEDQVKWADVVLLRGAEDFPDRAQKAGEMIRQLNPDAKVIEKPWEETTAQEILCPENFDEEKPQSARPSCECCHGHDHGHEHHAHDHAAEELFDTVTIKTDKIFTKEGLHAAFSRLEQSAEGAILRAKGIFQGEKGNFSLQYVPGELAIEFSNAEGGYLCVIGKDLNQRELFCSFNGE